MRCSSFDNYTFIGSSIMVNYEQDEFEELISKASEKANELNFKKLVLKSLRIDIEDKDPSEIESLYMLYVMSLYNDC